MASNHYETLGVPKGATLAEIRRAYRRLVLLHHPDRSKAPGSSARFIEATNAFEVLSDPSARRAYDLRLADLDRRQAAREDAGRRRAQAGAERSAREDAARSPTPPVVVSLAPELSRLTSLFARQQFAACERLAGEILRRDPRQSLPYAVLGDLARGRGQPDEAARMYAYALQMDPGNPDYLKRYEQMLGHPDSADRKNRDERRLFSVMAVVAILLLACLYVVVSQERGGLANLGPFSTWTLGLVVMLFVCGVAAGAAFSIGQLIDRLDSFTAGRLGPPVKLALVAIVSFPAAVGLYLGLGLAERAFNVTTTRLILAVGVVTVSLALASAASPAGTSTFTVLLWGGNLAYLGALCGWTVADSFRR